MRKTEAGSSPKDLQRQYLGAPGEEIQYLNIRKFCLTWLLLVCQLELVNTEAWECCGTRNGASV